MTAARFRRAEVPLTRDVPELEAVAREARRLTLRAVHRAKAGHLGGPLSAMDLLVALYFGVLQIQPAQPAWPERDRFVLSKGHSSIGLYAVMALRGYFAIDELLTFDSLGSRLQGHPDMTRLPGLDMSTGSLGQGLSPGVGMALGARLLGQRFRTWVMLGDGEAQEGQTWEAAMVAARYGLNHLIAILDLNGLQQYGWEAGFGYKDGARMPPLTNVRAKWEAFGWRVIETDGHDMAAILRACDDAAATPDRPCIVVARTIKGKGVSFIEGDFAWHARVPTDEELSAALAELADPEPSL